MQKFLPVNQAAFLNGAGQNAFSLPSLYTGKKENPYEKVVEQFTTIFEAFSGKNGLTH